MTEYRVILLRPTSYSEIFVLMAENAHAHSWIYRVFRLGCNYLPKQSYLWKPTLFCATKYSNVKTTSK